MAYRLALDVGTASCGLVAWGLDEDGQPATLDNYSVDIWQEPLQPAKSGGVGEPKKAARRAARMMRRQITRRARRLRRIAYLSARLGLDRMQIESDPGQTIHAIRARAADEPIELSQLVIVLLHLAKHRGPDGDWVYAAEAKSAKKPRGEKSAASDTVVSAIDETGPASANEAKARGEQKGIVGGVRTLEALIADEAAAAGQGSLTLGQFLHRRRERKESVVLGRPDPKVLPLYPSRRMVKAEFERIWNTQAMHHPVLSDPAIHDEFFDAIFHQRPLKSPAATVGRCPLEPTLPRAPAAQMAAQAFRIEKQIADLRWGMGRRAEPLNDAQRALLRRLLDERGEISFTAIVKAFVESGCPGPGSRGLNMDRASRDSLKGNTTLATFRKLGLEAEWQALDEKTRIQVINFLADLGSPDALDGDEWHLKFLKTAREDSGRKFKKPIKAARDQVKLEPRRFDASFIDFVNHLRRHPRFDRLSTMGFDGGRMGYSIKALRELTELMQSGAPEWQASLGLQWRSEIERPEHFAKRLADTELPLPPETGNIAVDVALRQVYRAVRRTIDKLGGAPAEVIVELSRDMALGVAKRGEIEGKIDKIKKARIAAKKCLEDEREPGTDRNVDRYLLWDTQSHYCPYCSDRISLGEALSSATEREHILPRSLTRVGGKRSQLVLAHKSCNNQKGNRTPWLAFGGDEARWRIIEERAAQLERNRQRGKARLLLLKDWQEEVLDDAAIQDFSDRQFHESSWIAKLTAQWLKSVCLPTERNGQPVSVSRGELTAHLRRIWKLNTVIPEIRYETGLPVLDEDGKPINSDDFDRHRSWWEGHDRRGGAIETERRPNKRIDHRHHLVDALVISLTSRSLYQRMARNYQEERAKEKRGERGRLSLHEAPPIAAIRDLALEAVRNVEIRHKPDRYPDGALFERTAYGRSRRIEDKTDDYRLAICKPLKALIDPANAAKTRGRLAAIESEATRDAVLAAFDARREAGVALKQIFDESILHPQFATPIRRIRLLGDSAGTALEVTHVNRAGVPLAKRYAHAGNAYLEIRVEDGKLVGTPRLVSVQQALKEKGSRPPTGVRRFCKGDTVSVSDGSRHVVGQIKGEAGGKLCLVPVTETCTFDQLTKRGVTGRKVQGKSLASVSTIDV